MGFLLSFIKFDCDQDQRDHTLGTIVLKNKTSMIKLSSWIKFFQFNFLKLPSKKSPAEAGKTNSWEHEELKTKSVKPEGVLQKKPLVSLIKRQPLQKRMTNEE